MMKKTVMMVAAAMGISSLAFAANPFSDVPQGHWAYASFAQLSGSGILEAYPDSTFAGERTMTRYEMAQIVAKALAKGAIGADDRLVAEFAEELDQLGVRVAALEKQANRVKITGRIRLNYRERSGKFHEDSDAKLRTRLYLTGEVNDTLQFVSMIQNQQYFLQGKNESGDSDTVFQRAYLQGRIGTVKVTAGRYNDAFAESNIYDNRVDGIKLGVNLGHASYLVGAYGKMASADVSSAPGSTGISAAGRYARAALGGEWGRFDGEINYVKAKDVMNMGKQGSDDKIWSVGTNYKLGKLKVGAMYLQGDNDVVDAYGGSDWGTVYSLRYRASDKKKTGSWGLFTQYFNQGAATVISHPMYGDTKSFPLEGYKGYVVGGNVTLAPNMVADVEWYDLKGKKTGKHSRTLWSMLNISF